MRPLLALSLLAVVTLSSLGACQDPKVPAGAVSTCDDRRHLLDCDAEIAYQGIKTEGGAHVLNLGGAQASFADTAVRQTNVQVEAYIAGQTRLCRSYNSCLGTQESYLADSRTASQRLADALGTLVESVPVAERTKALAATDTVLARPGETLAPLSFRFSLDAALPASAGGMTVTAPPNYPLPTNTQVVFKIEVPRAAHVYLFQVDAQKRVSVLFPDDRIAVKNPLSGGTSVVIPTGAQRFRLDENGLGTENVYILASERPLVALEQTLRRYASGEVEQLSKDSGLAELGSIEPGKKCTRSRNLALIDGAAPASRAEGADCVASRGFVLDTPPEPNQRVAHSLEARARPGDGVVIKVFPFQHVTEADHPASLKAYNAPTPAGVKTRGIAIDI